jgi:hypothetical protein
MPYKNIIHASITAFSRCCSLKFEKYFATRGEICVPVNSSLVVGLYAGMVNILEREMVDFESIKIKKFMQIIQ